MLDCLDNKIEIYICGERDETKDYINSLPGITLESLSAPTEADQKTYLGAWKDIVAEAKKVFSLTLITELSSCREYSKDCDYDTLFCEQKNLEAILPVWKYQLAIVLLEYRIYSTRINRFTLFDKDKAMELLKFYRERFDIAIKQAMRMIDLESCCLDCGGNPQFVTWLP